MKINEAILYIVLAFTAGFLIRGQTHVKSEPIEVRLVMEQ